MRYKGALLRSIQSCHHRRPKSKAPSSHIFRNECGYWYGCLASFHLATSSFTIIMLMPAYLDDSGNSIRTPQVPKKVRLFVARVFRYIADCVLFVYKISHFFFFGLLVRSAARVACSKTSRTPSLVLAEHSRYLYAPIFLRTSSA